MLIVEGAVYLRRLRVSTLRVNAVDLKNVLRKINTNRDNFAHGRLLFPRGSWKPQPWHIAMPLGGSRPQHQEWTLIQTGRSFSTSTTATVNAISETAALVILLYAFASETLCLGYVLGRHFPFDEVAV